MGWNGTDRNRGLLPNTVRNSAEESWSSKPVVGSSNLSGPAKQYCLLAQWQSNRPIIDRHKFDSCTGNHEHNSKRCSMKKFDIEKIKDFIDTQGPETRIYIGVDSERLRVNNVWMADYIAAIVVHMDGKHGCKLFGEVTRERDYDQRVDRPNTRLMNEVYKVSELYLKLADVLEGRSVEVHLDINPDDNYASSNVVTQAIGYIRGTCNVIPLVKPEAFAASYAADRYKSLRVA